MSEIVLQQVNKTYKPGLFKKKVPAVKGLDLEVNAGEVFGLIGPNGAGKSTTIRLMLGLIRADSGRIFFRNKPVKDSAFQHEIGYLPENPYLYDHLNLVELLRFCGRVSGMPDERINQRSQELMEKLNLVQAQKRPLRTFSKGMMQRAAICFALLHDPSLVILDEPMSGLDPLGRKMVFDLVGELESAGKTVFFCSHILSDVERLCDRIGVMVNGRLVRTLNKKDFWLESGGSVFLSVPPLLDSQRGQIERLVDSVVDERDGHVLAIAPEKLPHAAGKLADLGISVDGSRAEGISLEKLFMRLVQEAQP